MPVVNTAPSLLSEDLEAQRQQYGTKVVMMIDLMQKTLAKDPTAKFVVFSQWNQLLNYANEALSACGIRCVTRRHHCHPHAWCRKTCM